MFFVIVLFVFIWSTGFVVAKIVIPHADPTLFVFVRVCISAVLFGAVAWFTKAPRLPWREVPRHIVTGVLMQGLYISSVYWGITEGLPPAIMALIGSTQPLFTAALAAPLLGERLTVRIVTGLALGMAGVLLVIAPGLSGALDQHYSWLALFYAALSVLSITFGTLLQKTSVSKVDIRTSSVWQNVGTLLFAGCFTLIRGESRWVWTPELWGALLWSSLVMTVAGTSVLMWIIRRGGATKASSLIFLQAPLAAAQAYVLFGDVLQGMQLLGFAIAVSGVLLCNLPNWRARK
jgi:drug/metabolite transporter (DMT)-like permease